MSQPTREEILQRAVAEMNAVMKKAVADIRALTLIRSVNKPTTVICLKGKKEEWGESLQRAPKDVVYIGRATNPAFSGGWKLKKSRWANPFSVKKEGSREAVIEKYRDYLDEMLKDDDAKEALQFLKGKTLACWCSPDECHGDVLVEMLDW